MVQSHMFYMNMGNMSIDIDLYTTLEMQINI